MTHWLAFATTILTPRHSVRSVLPRGPGRVAGYLLLAGAALLATSCKGPGGSMTGPDTGSHWLELCDSDSSCGEGLECLCERCTLPCDEDEACSEIGSSAACDANAACGGVSVCVGECLRDTDCPDSAPTCLAERCVASNVTGAAEQGSSAGGASASTTGEGGRGPSNEAAAGAGGDEAASSSTTECAPLGAYELVSVTPNPVNDATCEPPPPQTFSIDANGLPGFTSCADLMGCDDTNCLVQTVSEESCTAKLRFETPCGTLPDGVTTYDYNYDGDTLTIVRYDTNFIDGPCGFTVVAVRGASSGE